MKKPERKIAHTWQKGNIGGRYQFNEIDQTGAYVTNWSGHLLRIWEESLEPGHSPVMDMVGSEPLYVTKISDNPYEPLGKARQVAADLDCEVNF